MKGNNFITALKAIEDGDTDLLKRVIKGNREIITKCSKSGTLLHHAVITQETNMNIIDFLLSIISPSMITYRNSNFNSPAFEALNRACKLDSRDHKSITKRFLSKDSILGYNSKIVNTVFFEVCKLDKLDIANVLVDIYKADINYVNTLGYTSLHIATQEGNISIVKFLVEQKVNVNLQVKGNTMSNEYNGCTPLYIATKEGYIEIVKFLIKNKADISLDDDYGKTPLHVAVREGHQKIVSILIKNKADINISDNDCYTPLHIATKRGNTKTVKFLIESEADVTAPDNNNNTPLHIAAREGYTEIAESIIKASNLNKILELLENKEICNMVYNINIDYVNLFVNTFSEISTKNSSYIHKWEKEHDITLLRLYQHLDLTKFSNNQTDNVLTTKNYFIVNYFTIIGVCKTINGNIMKIYVKDIMYNILSYIDYRVPPLLIEQNSNDVEAIDIIGEQSLHESH